MLRFKNVRHVTVLQIKMTGPFTRLYSANFLLGVELRAFRGVWIDVCYMLFR